MSYRLVMLNMAYFVIPCERYWSDVGETHQTLSQAIDTVHEMLIAEMHRIIFLSIVLWMYGLPQIIKAVQLMEYGEHYDALVLSSGHDGGLVLHSAG